MGKFQRTTKGKLNEKADKLQRRTGNFNAHRFTAYNGS
jgi:hypothetical protein